MKFLLFEKILGQNAQKSGQITNQDKIWTIKNQENQSKWYH